MSAPGPEICPLCRYDLTGVDAGSPCPECGASAEAMAEARRRREGVAGALRIATWVYLLGMVPAWICLAALIAGWNTAVRLGAHRDIPFVQDGDYPTLDRLGSVVLLSALLSLLCMPCLLALPVVLWCRWRTERKPLRVLIWAAILLAASAPYIEAFLGLHRQFTPFGLSLGAWMPD